MALTTFYAWAVPAFISESPVDHTWVTTYDNRVTHYPNDQAVAAAGQSYWYCWGSFHASGGVPGNPTGLLGQKAGDVVFATCLVRPNADSRTTAAARGTIFTYGIDGVCHQLANQVLYATGTGGSLPLTVSAARGYMASVFIYGTYGLQHAAWANKLATCGGSPVAATARRGRGAVSRRPRKGVMTGAPDDFEARARSVLGKSHPEKLAELLSLRADTIRFAAQRWPGLSAPGAETLNARNQHLIDQAAALLRADHFRKIFGLEPGTKLTLVDPNMLASDGGKGKPTPSTSKKGSNSPKRRK
jgi:hypothetical protein